MATACSRIARANPVISSTVSPRIASAVMNEAICAGVASPSIIIPMASCASASSRVWCAATLAIAGLSAIV